MKGGSGDPQVLVYLHIGVLIVCDAGVPDLPQMLHEGLHQPFGLRVIGTLVGDVLDTCPGKVLLKLMSVLPSLLTTLGKTRREKMLSNAITLAEALVPVTTSTSGYLDM